MAQRKIIITGSEGIIGKRLSADFQAMEDVGVVALDLSQGHDLTDENVVSELMKTHSDADYLVNLFAINDHVEEGQTNPGVLDISLESLRKFCEVNLVALFSVCRAFAKYSTSPAGILNFASLYGVRSPKKFIYGDTEKHIGYTMTKHGVVGLTKHLATHLSPIRVNCLVPGGILHTQDETFVTEYARNVPLNRMMQASELTGIVDLLCSEKASYITGAAIPIDGGWTAW